MIPEFYRQFLYFIIVDYPYYIISTKNLRGEIAKGLLILIFSISNPYLSSIKKLQTFKNFDSSSIIKLIFQHPLFTMNRSPTDGKKDVAKGCLNFLRDHSVIQILARKLIKIFL